MSLKKKKEEEFSVADSIINGTWDDGSLNVSTPQTQSVANTVDTLNNVSNNIKKSKTTTMSFDDDKKEETSSVAESIIKGENPLSNNAAFVGKSAGAGLTSGLTGIVDAPLQNIQEGAQKGKKKSKLENYIQGLVRTFDVYGVSSAVESMPEINKILQDKNKKGWEKALNIGGALLNNNPLVNNLEAAGQQLNIFDKNAEKDIKKAREIVETPSNKLNESVAKDSEKMSGGWKIAGEVSQTIGNMIPSMALTAVTKNPDIGLAAMGVSAKGQATKEAEERGADLNTANEIGLGKGLVEVGTEKLTGGLKFFGKGTADDLVEKGINKAIKNKAGNFIAKQAVGMAGEVGEETISDLVDTAIDKATVDPDASYSFDDWKKTALMTMLSTGALNTISGGYGRKAYQLNAEELNEIAQSKKVQDTVNERVEQFKTPDMTPEQVEQLREQTTAVVLGEIQQNVDDILDSSIAQLQEQPQIPTQTPINTLSSNIQEQNNQILGQEQTPQITPLNQVNQELQETRQQDVADSVRAMNLEQEPEFTQKQGNYVYEKSDNSKIDNLRKDAANYLKEGEQTTNFVNTLEKLVKDKDIEIRFDTKLGNNVNGTYKNGVITINPNSNRAGEFVAIHELTHAIGTKPMIDMIQTYRKSNAKFNNAVERLLSTYNTTEINEEALGDIAGQLFGNQEYINNLSMENPSLFKRIYNEIKYLWHQFTGYKNQDQFIEDLRNKWESAYRNQKVQQKAKNSNIEMSNQTDSNGNMLSNEQVDYFKNSKVRDENGNLLEVYHGTPTPGFTIFDTKKSGRNTSSGEYGLYFTDSKQFADDFSYERLETDSMFFDKKGEKGDVYPVYLNSKNMLDFANLTKKEIENLYTYASNLGKIDGKEKFVENMLRWQQIGNHQLMKGNLDLKAIADSSNYDGIKAKLNVQGNENEYIVFNSNQIKNIDNLTPTQNEDIRYSKEETGAIENLNNIKGYKVQEDTYPYDNVIGHSFDLKTKDGTAHLQIRETTDKVYLNMINTRLGNSTVEKGAGTKILNNLKEYSDKTGKQLVIAGEVPSASKFYDKFEWLTKEKGEIIDDDGNLFDISSNNRIYNPKSTNKYSKEEEKKIKAQIKGEFREFNNYYDYAKEIAKDNNELAKELLFKNYTYDFDVPTNKNEVKFYHGTDAVYDYDSLKTMDFDEQTMDRNYGDYFYITPDKNFSHTYGNQIAQFIVPKDKIMSLEDFNKSGLTEEEVFKKYWAIEMPDNEYIVADPKQIIEYSKSKAQEYIKKQSQNNKELDNSSFSLKEKQNDIIQRFNPVNEESTQTWIRSADDIKTLEETLQDSDWSDYDEFNPDLTKQDIENAIKTGKITVYSSYPIEQGIFVSPSKMEAESYSGNGKVYSKEVPIQDVAWIDPTQGQYAKVENQNIKTKDNTGRELSKQQQEYFKDSKIRNDKGELLEVYHGTNNDFTVFDKSYLGSASGDVGFLGDGFYFATHKGEADYYGGKSMKTYLNVTNPYNIQNLHKYKGMNLRGEDSNPYIEIKNLVDMNPEWKDIKIRYGNTYGDIANATDEILNSISVEDLGETDNGHQYKVNVGNDFNIVNTINNYSIDELKADAFTREMRDKFGFINSSDVIQDITDEARMRKLNNQKPVKTFSEVLEENGYDGIIQGEKASDTDEIVVFNPNQIKNVDNTNPTEDPDIRYSKDNATWKEYLEKEFPSQGTRTNLDSINTEKTKKTSKTISKGETTEDKSKNAIRDGVNAFNLEKKQKVEPIKKSKVEETPEYESMILYTDTGRDSDFKDFTQLDNGNIIARAKNGTYSVIQGNKFIVDGEKIPTNGKYKTINSSLDEDMLKLNDNNFTDIKLSKDETQPKKSNTINESKQDDVVMMSAKDITNTLNDTKKGIVPDGKKMRRWVDTSNTATGMEDSINKADIDKITYEVQSNKKTYDQAVANTKNMSYEQKVFNAQNKLNTNKKITPTDLAEAQLALREAATSGDMQTYLNLQQDIAIMGTELGQLVQSLSMIQKLSPDGQLMMLQKIVNRQQKLGNKNWDGVEFKEELVKKVLDSYDDNSHTTFNKEKMDQAIDNLKQDLADQMKVGISDKVNEWRYLSMLGNPKTHIRNIVANVAMTTTKRIKDTLNAGMQDLLIRDSSKKTATLKTASKEVKELSKQAYKETFEVNQGNKYNEKNEIENKRQIFKTKPIEALRKVNAKALDIEDQAFKKLEFQRAFSNYLTAQKIKTSQDIETHPEIIQQAKAFALEESKIATFQQDNEFANWINKLDKKGPIAKVVRGAIIPFTRTPLNIAKTGLEYAPGTGLLTTIADVKKAPANMKGNVAINGISKQITGTSLALLGYALAKSGLLQSGEDEDKEGKFKKDQGLSMGFSIKLGDKFYDLSWLSPSSMPLFVGASIFEQLEKTDGIDGNVVMEGIANTLDPLSEMSCISSFTDVLQSFQRGSSKMISQMGQKTAQNYISQFVPTVSSQFARLFDTKKRVTNADRTSGFKFGEETKNQLMYKIPGLRNLLPEQTDYFGETKEEEQNVLVRGLEAFLSPANTKKDISTTEAQELLDLYNSTGDTDVLPSSLAKYLKYDGENINMSNKEWNDYKYNFGTTLKENLNELMGNYEYTDATPEQKAEMVSGLMKYSKDKAKDMFLESQGKEWEYTSDRVDAKRDGNFSVAEYYIIKNQAPKVFNGKAEDVQKKISAANDIGISLVDYYNIKSEINTLKADKDSNGKTISGSKKQKVVDYVNSLDYLDDEQKYGMLSSIYKKW